MALKIANLIQKYGFCSLYFSKAIGTPSIFDVGYKDAFCPCNDKSLIDQQECFDCLHWVSSVAFFRGRLSENYSHVG